MSSVTNQSKIKKLRGQIELNKSLNNSSMMLEASINKKILKNPKEAKRLLNK